MTDIADAVIAAFVASRVAQKKLIDREWTVLAGIVLRVAPEHADTATFRVLTWGTGTKCLGRRDLDAQGLVVNDCHAEIVARRAFVRYLYQEAIEWTRGTIDKTASIFMRDEASGKLILKPQHTLHLFISESPCGDAAIYALDTAVVDALVERRTQREVSHASSDRSELRLTGAKHKRMEDETNEAPKTKRFEQTVGVARVKSGRSDLPTDKLTLSMSCSDKIAVWNVVGWQGTLLQRWFRPLLMTSIVVANDPASRSTTAQCTAMQRALCDRVAGVHPVELRIVPVTAFPHTRQDGKSPSSLSLNWTQREPHWTTVPTTSPKSWEATFFGSSDVEVLMAATGFKEGAKKASQMDTKTKQRVASRLSKWSLFRAYDAVRSADVTDTLSRLTVYKDEKLAVGGSPPPDHVKQALGEWIGVPPSFKAFAPYTE